MEHYFGQVEMYGGGWDIILRGWWVGGKIFWENIFGQWGQEGLVEVGVGELGVGANVFDMKFKFSLLSIVIPSIFSSVSF